MLRITPTIFAITLVCLTVTSPLTHAQNDLWRSYAEFDGRAGGQATQGQANLFVPVLQDCNSLLFLDARRSVDDLSGTGGSWGLAYRKMLLPEEWIFGVNVFFDVKDTEHDNSFDQGGFGLELLDVNHGFRFNAYIPDGDVHSASGLDGAFLENGNLVVRPGQEASYYGVDFEAEKLIWMRDGGESHIDVELWASAGVFHFDNNNDRFEAMTGPRIRTELRLFDLARLGRDSRLVFAGQYEHDAVRGSQGTGIINIRIPFGPGGGNCNPALGCLNRRMVAPIVRNSTIITNAGAFGANEAAQLASTGQAISQAIVVDANTAGIAAAIAGAGADSLVVVDGSAGTLLPGGSLVTNPGQVLVGGGSGVAVIGSDGTPAVFNASGTRPTIINTNSAVDSVVVASDASVVGLDVTGGNFGIASTNNGTDALSADSLVSNNNVTASASHGFQFDNVDGTLTNNTATGAGGDGFNLSSINAGATVSDNTATNSAAHGFAMGSVDGTFTNNTAADSGANGFDFIHVNSGGTFSNNTATDSVAEGFNFTNVDGTFASNTATGNGAEGFRFDDVNVGGQFTDNTASGNTLRGYRLDDVDGNFANNTATSNGDDGFRLDDVNGTFANNTATSNGDEGYQFGDVNPGGAFTDNSANTNVGQGYLGANNGGTATGNTGAGNSGGNTFP